VEVEDKPILNSQERGKGEEEDTSAIHSLARNA